MNKGLMVWVGVALGLALVGCSDDSPEPDQGDPSGCEGERVEVDGEVFCVYERSVIVEEGFACPAATPHLHERGDVGICAADEEVPDDVLAEVERRYGRVEPTPEGEPEGIVLTEIGQGCASPAPLKINVEPLEAEEEFIVLFDEGTDVGAVAEAMAAFYGFEVEQVFDIIPAFSAVMSLDVVEAIRCFGPVASVEQSRTDIGPPEGCRANGECAEGDYCAAINDPNVCGIPPQEGCFSHEECGEEGRCHAISDSCSQDGIGSQCGSPCAQDAECGEGFTCNNEGGCVPQSCEAGFECRLVQVCDPAPVDPQVAIHALSTGCVFVACQQDGDCVEGLFCVKGICQEALGVCSEDLPVP